MSFKRHLESDSTRDPIKRVKYLTNAFELSCVHIKSSASQPSPFGKVASKLTPEKMAANIKEEADRLNRRKQLPPFAGDPAEVESMEARDEGVQNEQKPLFTYSDIGLICSRLLREQEERIRDEYDKILSAKLAEQYDTFVKFTHDQIQHKFKSEAQPSYLS